jgi:hypothetical protein|nr:MAG TPA: hypothetical protein [Caudoviricetes sp.]
MTRYTMPARSQGNLYIQHATARLSEEDVHTWPSQRLDSFYCDLQTAYMSHVARPVQARTHIVLHYPPAPTARAEGDEIISVGLQGSNPRDAVKALIQATGLNPHMSVCGWPFCLDDVGGVDDMEGGAV